MSADTLLGLEWSETGEADDGYPEEILKNLRFSLEPLVLSFEEDLVQVFPDGDYIGLVEEQRVQLSREGILLPKVRLRDDLSWTERIHPNICPR